MGLLGDYEKDDLITAAGVLIHEVVEVYYNVAQNIGLFGASRHMDFVAEHFTGVVVEQLDRAGSETRGE